MASWLKILLIPFVFLSADVIFRFSLFTYYTKWQFFFYCLSVVVSCLFFILCIRIFRALSHYKLPVIVLQILLVIFYLISFVGSLSFFSFNGFFPNYYTLLYFKTEPESAYKLLIDSLHLSEILACIIIGVPLFLYIRYLSKNTKQIAANRIFILFCQTFLLYFFLWIYHRKFDQCLTVDSNFAIAIQRHLADSKNPKNFKGKGHQLRTPLQLVKEQNKPNCNVLVVIFESLRKDKLQSYGYKRNTTPHLTQFQKSHSNEFFVFQRPYTVSSTTMLAVPAILAGVAPQQNISLYKTQPLIWEFAKTKNYHTFFLSSHTMNWYRFDRFYQNSKPDFFWTKDESGIPYFNDLGIDDHHTVNKLVAHLTKQNTPFFGAIQLNGTHYPYVVPEKFNKWNNQFSDQYDNAILYQDDALNQLFQFLKTSGKDKNTILIFVSDHAESLKEHNNIGHVDSYYAETIQIPLMVYIPTSLQKHFPIQALKKNLNQTVSSIDITPTIIDLLDIKRKENLSAKDSLLGFSLFSKIPDKRDLIILNNNKLVQFRVGLSMIHGDYHYINRVNIVPNREEIYDLRNDPKEENNLTYESHKSLYHYFRKTFYHEKNCRVYQQITTR